MTGSCASTSRTPPPGTSKWNKLSIVSSVTLSRIGADAPLGTFETIVELIDHMTIVGQRVKAKLDKRQMPCRRSRSDAGSRAALPWIPR